MKVCFLLTHIPNPRMNKRIDLFKREVDTYVICTRRKSQNVWEPVESVEHIIYDIDLPSAKRIVKRYLTSQSFQKKALEKLIELRPNVIYAEGLDTLIIANKYKKKYDAKIVYEVADLRENYIIKPKEVVAKIINTVLIKREKQEFRNVDLLVVTSPKFYDVHYKSLISKDKMLYIPNMPNSKVFDFYKKKQGGDFTVGFIGGIRYLDQMKLLVDAAEVAGCKVLFAGAGGTSFDYENIQEYCKEREYVQFTGRYDYNTQIASIYGMVDCVFAVYDADNPNVKIALPNKLYESILCELPIIVAKGTYLEMLVKEWGVGIGVGHKGLQDLTEALTRLKSDKEFYNRIVDECRRQKESFKLDDYMKRITDIIER